MTRRITKRFQRQHERVQRLKADPRYEVWLIGLCREFPMELARPIISSWRADEAMARKRGRKHDARLERYLIEQSATGAWNVVAYRRKHGRTGQ